MSHWACLSSVETAVGVRSVESDSKKTRSPTLTTKSCVLPGVAAPPAPKPVEAVSSVLAQAAMLKAATTASANLRPRTENDVIMGDTPSQTSAEIHAPCLSPDG